jgi:hypothetical protein
MTTEELLKPRYKVIADFPASTISVGDIIQTNESTVAYVVEINDHSDKYAMKDYPHLFKKLAWWEERKVEDMPEYVKHGANGLVRKLERYCERSETLYFAGGRTRRIKKEWLPSTISEYEKQNKTNLTK